MCRANTCCCCCSLWTGSLAIGILDLLSVATLFIYSVIVPYYTSQWDDDVWYNASTYHVLFVKFRAVAIIITGILLISDIFLLIGVAQGKEYLISPWLVFSYISVSISFIATIWIGINYTQEHSRGFKEIAYALCNLGVKTYFIVVVQSHYSVLKARTCLDVPTNPTLPQPHPNGQ